MSTYWPVPVGILAIILVSGCTQPVGTITLDVAKTTTDIVCPFNLTPNIHKIGTDFECPKIYSAVLKNSTPVICPTELPLSFNVNGTEFVSGAADYNYSDIIPIDYFVRCDKGKDVGENPKHWYCRQFDFYYDRNNLDGTGVIKSKLRIFPTFELDGKQDIINMTCASKIIE